MPDDAARMNDDEVKGEEEYNEELRRKKANVEDAPFDAKMDFGNESAQEFTTFNNQGKD